MMVGSIHPSIFGWHLTLLSSSYRFLFSSQPPQTVWTYLQPLEIWVMKTAVFFKWATFFKKHPSLGYKLYLFSLNFTVVKNGLDELKIAIQTFSCEIPGVFTNYIVPKGSFSRVGNSPFSERIGGIRGDVSGCPGSEMTKGVSPMSSWWCKPGDPFRDEIFNDPGGH